MESCQESMIILFSSSQYKSMLKWINENLNKGITAETHQPIKSETEQQRHIQNLQGIILDYEFRCQSQEASKDLIAELIKLYTIAVEIYESKDDSRYRLFQKRMEIFLKKPNIDQILRGKSGSLVSRRDTAQKHISHAINKSKGQVNKLLDKSQKVTNLNLGKLQNSLKAQQSTLTDRIERRKAMSNRSSRTRDDEQNEQGKTADKKMSMKLILDGIQTRKGQNSKRVFI